ncbi:hypothetical protein SNEBB_006833 [Seison nebaliae]|nr:hypothetical protein SNEBB_006833 [Seison nebaliae]
MNVFLLLPIIFLLLLEITAKECYVGEGKETDPMSSYKNQTCTEVYCGTLKTEDKIIRTCGNCPPATGTVKGGTSYICCSSNLCNSVISNTQSNLLIIIGLTFYYFLIR